MHKTQLFAAKIDEAKENKCERNKSWLIKEFSKTGAKISKLLDNYMSKESLVPASFISCSIVCMINASNNFHH